MLVSPNTDHIFSGTGQASSPVATGGEISRAVDAWTENSQAVDAWTENSAADRIRFSAGVLGCEESVAARRREFLLLDMLLRVRV